VKTVKEMLEFAGVDITKGKAKELVEIDNRGLPFQSSHTNPKIAQIISQLLNDPSDEDMTKALTQVYNLVRGGKLTVSEFMDVISGMMNEVM
jgi:hypothetical protein